MKASQFLSRIGLYQPAKRVIDILLNAKMLHSVKLKRFFYRKTLERRMKAGVLSGFGPNVLVVMNCGGIGNSVEGTPVVEGIRSLWPKAVITIVVPSGDLYEGWCVPDNITDSVEDIRGRSFDHSFFPYAFLSQIWPWKEICDLGEIHHPRVWLRKYFLKPEREYAMDMLKTLGYNGPVPPLYVSVKNPDIEIAVSDLRICLVPGAKKEPKWRHKRWPYYGDLAEVILAKYPDSQICVIGMKDDSFPAGSLGDSRINDLRGRLSLAESAWVLKTAHLAVGNDCGPMHIAYAVQTPSIVIFGPTCQIKNAPLNKAVALSSDLPCSPCQYNNLLETCPDPCCMKEIRPQLVMEKAEQVLLLRDKE